MPQGHTPYLPTVHRPATTTSIGGTAWGQKRLRLPPETYTSPLSTPLGAFPHPGSPAGPTATGPVPCLCSLLYATSHLHPDQTEDRGSAHRSRLHGCYLPYLLPRHAAPRCRTHRPGNPDVAAYGHITPPHPAPAGNPSGRPLPTPAVLQSSQPGALRCWPLPGWSPSTTLKVSKSPSLPVAQQDRCGPFFGCRWPQERKAPCQRIVAEAPASVPI